jgi:hypothetical protein
MFYLAWITTQICLGIIFINAVEDYHQTTTTIGESIYAIITWPYIIMGQLVYKFFYWSISNNG